MPHWNRIALFPLLVGVLLASAVFVACGGDDSEEPSAEATTSMGGSGAAGTVNITQLKDFSIELDEDEVAAGPVTFAVTNKGALPHEVIVIDTDVAPDKLTVGGDGTVDLSKLAVSGRTELLDVGVMTNLDVTLAAGKYVLIRNVAGHYQAGMHTALTVN